MADDVDMGAQPQSGLEYPVRLGESFTQGTQHSGYYTLRYDFKPQSVSRTEPAVLQLEEDGSNANKVLIWMHNKNNGELDVHFKGNLESANDLECVAIFDGSSFQLEMIGGQMKTRHIRAAEPYRPSQLAPAGDTSHEQSPDQGVSWPPSPRAGSSQLPSQQKQKQQKKSAEPRANINSAQQTKKPPQDKGKPQPGPKGYSVKRVPPSQKTTGIKRTGSETLSRTAAADEDADLDAEIENALDAEDVAPSHGFQSASRQPPASSSSPLEPQRRQQPAPRHFSPPQPSNQGRGPPAHESEPLPSSTPSPPPRAAPPSKPAASSSSSDSSSSDDSSSSSAGDSAANSEGDMNELEAAWRQKSDSSSSDDEEHQKSKRSKQTANVTMDAEEEFI